MTTATTTPFKAGDWVFCEFELQMIREVHDDGRVTEVTDGVCRHSGRDLSDRCRPLTYDFKQISDSFKWASDRLHREGSVGLNYPDIHRWLVEKWCEACDHASDVEASRALLTELREFTENALRKSEIDSGYGFPLMRRR